MYRIIVLIAFMTAMLATLFGCGQKTPTSVDVSMQLRDSGHCEKVIASRIVAYTNMPLSHYEMSKSLKACGAYADVKKFYASYSKKVKVPPLHEIIPHKYSDMTHAVMREVVYGQGPGQKIDMSPSAFMKLDLSKSNRYVDVDVLTHYWKDLIVSAGEMEIGKS